MKQHRHLSALLGLLLAATGHADAPVWRMIESTSSLGFIATWEGTPFRGQFGEFDADIRFAPDELADSRFEVTIDVTTADTGSRDRDEAMADPDWFDHARYPLARFVAARFEPLADGRYAACGELTIKGRTQKVRLPFAWRSDGDKAVLQTEVVLQRTDYGIGEGEWADGEIIGLDVRVVGELELEPVR